MTGEADKIKRLQVIVSEAAYAELLIAVQTLKEQGDTNMSLSRFAKDAIRKHYREVFGKDIDLGADVWGGPREIPPRRKRKSRISSPEA